MIAITEGKPDVILGDTTFNISRFAGQKKNNMILPIKEGYFTLQMLVSVVDMQQGNEIGVDIAKLFASEDVGRQKKIHPTVLAAIKA